MEDDAFDLYDDLEDFDYKVKYEESEEKVKELKRKLDEATKKVMLLEEQKSELQSKIDNLERSFQSLLLTARSEIKRKDAQIADARKERDDLVFRRQKQPHFNKQNPFRTNAQNPENSGITTKLTHDINNEDENTNKENVKNFVNENKTQVNPVPKNYDHNKHQQHVTEKIEKLPPVECHSNDTNRCENQTPSHNASNNKVKNNIDQHLDHPEKTVSAHKSRSRSHEKHCNQETNIQNKDEGKIQKVANHETALENHTKDKYTDKSDHKRNDIRGRSPSPVKMDDKRRRNSKDSNERRTEHHGYREPRDHREQGYRDRERGSKDQEKGKNDREKENDRKKEINNLEKLNDRGRRNIDRERENKVREKEKVNKERDKVNNDRDKPNKDRIRRNSDREKGNNDRERRNNDREKENDRDRRNKDLESENNSRETRNNVREKENNSRNRVKNDRDRQNTDRSRGIIDRDQGNNARDRRYNDRDRNHVRQTDRHRELPIKNSDSDHHRMDREHERHKDRNPSIRNENRTHNHEREKVETKKIESKKNVDYKLHPDKLDPKPGRSLHESNKKEKDNLAHNRRDNSELDRRRNDRYNSHRERNGSLEEKHKSKDIGKKRHREDEPIKEASKHQKSSPLKKRKLSERKQEKIKSNDTINVESIVPDAIDSFSEDHLEALKRQLEMQLNGEISNDAKFSSDEDEIPEPANLLVEPTQNSNLNTNDLADAVNDSAAKSSKEITDIKNITNESDYTQVDMEIEPPRSVQVDVVSENLTFSPDSNQKPQENVEEIVPLCKKKRAMSALNAVERSDEKKSKSTEKIVDTVDIKGQHNIQALDNNISKGSKETNPHIIEEHSDKHTVNSQSVFISTESSENIDKASPASKGVEENKSKEIDDYKKKPSPCRTDNDEDDRKEIISKSNDIVNVSYSNEINLNEYNKTQNHQLNEDNTKIDAVQPNENGDIPEYKGEECDTKIVDHSNSTNIENAPNSDNQAKVQKFDNEKKETNNGSSCETSSDFSPRGSSYDSTSDEQSSSEYTTHSSSSKSHSEEEQEKPAFLKSSTQMLKDDPVSASMQNLDASVDVKNASSGNRFQSSLESPKNSEENEEEVLETPIKPPKHVKLYRIQKNDDSQNDIVGKIVIVSSSPSKVVQEEADQSKKALKRKRESESSESSIKRSRNDADSDKNDPNAAAITDMKFDSLNTSQLDALEKQLAFEVYGEDIYKDTTKDIKKEQNNQSLNLSNDSIFGSNELNSSSDKCGMLTNANEVNDIDADRDKLNHKILKEMGLEESEQFVEPSDHESQEEKNQTEFRFNNSDSTSKENSEGIKSEVAPYLTPPEVKAENHSNSSNHSTESAEVEILGTIEILPSRSHDIQSQNTIQYVKGPQGNSKKSIVIPSSSHLKTMPSDVEMKGNKGNDKSSKTAPKSKLPKRIKKETTSKSSPAGRGSCKKLNETPKIIGDESRFTPLILEKLKDSTRIISKTKDGIWLKCDCVSSECAPVAEITNLPKCTPIPECQPGALGIPLPGNVSSKEDVIVTVGKPLEESKSKQRKAKSNDNQQSTKSTSKSKPNVKMIGHIIEGFEREPSPPESKLDTSRELKHELFKEALGITSSTPYKSDSKVSDSSSNESIAETTDKKIPEDLESGKTKSKSKKNNHVDNVNLKAADEEVSTHKPPESTDMKCKKEEIIADSVDPSSSQNKARHIESSENMSSQIQILDVQIIQGCALNEANQLKCDVGLTNTPKEHPKSVRCKNVEESEDEPKPDKFSKQEPVVSRNRKRSSKAKEAVSKIKTSRKHQENKTDAHQLAKQADECSIPSNELSSSAKVPTKTPISMDSSDHGEASNNSDTIPHSKDCDIQKPTAEHIRTIRKSPVADAIETLTSTEGALLTAADACPISPSVVKSVENPTCNEDSPNTSLLSRSQHEKRNISIASTDYVIEKVDNNVVNVFITRKKVKKKKKV